MIKWWRIMIIVGFIVAAMVAAGCGLRSDFNAQSNQAGLPIVADQ